MQASRQPLLVRWYRRAVERLPAEFRAQYGGEMVRSLESLLAAERRHRGRGAALVLWVRAMADLGRTRRRLGSRRARPFLARSLGADVAYAVRQVRRTPGFSATVVLTIALSMGAVTAVFTVADPVLFRPLPYPDSDRLVDVVIDGDRTVGYASLPDLLRAGTDHPGFESVMSAMVSDASGYLATTDEPLAGRAVTAGFFHTLAVAPTLGREFGPADYQVSPRPQVAIISDGLWRLAFDASSDVLGRKLVMTGAEPRAFEIVGVLPPGFVFPDLRSPPDFIVPWTPDRNRMADPTYRFDVIARLRSGVTLAQATERMQAVVAGVERDFPALGSGRRVVLEPLHDVLLGRVASTLLVLLGATLGILSLAAVNLSHLAASRFIGRTGELVTRAALGAGPWRLARQLLVEAGLLAGFGWVASLIVARWLVTAVVVMSPERWHAVRLLAATMDGRVILCGMALTGVTFLGFGLLPALRAGRLDLRGSAQRHSGRRRPAAGRDALTTVVQTAAVVSLVVTGLLVGRSFVRAALKPLGFDPAGVQEIDIVWPADVAASPARLFEAQRAVVAGLRARMTTQPAVSEGMPAMTLPFMVRGDGQPEGDRPQVIAYPVNRGFFDVFRLVLRRGRLPTEEEAFSDAPVTVVDERAARQLWLGEEPLGRLVRDVRGRVWRVVGIVQALDTVPLKDAGRGTAFVPIASDSGRPWMLRYRGPGGPSIGAVRALVADIEPRAVVHMGPAPDPIALQLAQPRFLALLLGTLAAMAVVLAVVGLSGVVAHDVTRRRREMGIRLALGADGRRLVRLVTVQVLRPASVGVLCGLLGAWWASGLIAGQLHGVSGTDPTTYAAAAAGVLAAVGAAAFGPARRAARVQPREIIQGE